MFNLPSLVDCPLGKLDNIGLVSTLANRDQVMAQVRRSRVSDPEFWDTPKLWVGTADDYIYNPPPEDATMRLWVLASNRLENALREN